METLAIQENISGDFIITKEKISFYLESKERRGIKPRAVQKYRYSLEKLFGFLNSRPVSGDGLTRWRDNMAEQGCSKTTVQRHITVVNDFFRFYGRGDLCAPRPTRLDLAGQTFGYLTALYPTGEKIRSNVIWRCACRCGRQTDVPAVRLVRGNTTSCGCLNREILEKANMYTAGTSLRKALKDNPVSSNASGYTGVYPKNGKWLATITYKGKRYNLGTFSKLEDAVKARRSAKEKVVRDATELYRRLNSENQ